MKGDQEMKRKERIVFFIALTLIIISFVFVLVPTANPWDQICCLYAVDYMDGTGCHIDYPSNCVFCYPCVKV